MPEIIVDFIPEMQEATLASRKSCTSRFRLLGRVGDWFRMGKKKYIITRIDICDLGYVANYLYREEGCNSPDEFWRVWKEIHPRRTNPKLTVWVHHFIPLPIDMEKILKKPSMQRFGSQIRKKILRRKK